MRAFPYQSIFNQSENPPWDRLTGVDDHRIEAAANWTNGVYPDDGWKVKPGAGMSVVVSPGKGRINGVFCYDDDPHTGGFATEGRILVVQAADESLDRIDRVVIRHNDTLNMRATDMYILKGNPSAAPTAPELTRNSSIYELCVAEIFVARGTGTISEQRITDTRANFDLCGFTTTKVMDLALDQIKELLKNAISGTVAGQLQNAISSLVICKTDIQIKDSAAVRDGTYSQYPYRLDIPIADCTAKHVPDVYLGAAGNDLFCEDCESRMGSVRVYLANNNFGTITIPTLKLVKEA